MVLSEPIYGTLALKQWPERFVGCDRKLTSVFTTQAVPEMLRPPTVNG